MKVADGIQIFTAEEYFLLEETSEIKHEFFYGKLFDMPGAPVLHNDMCLNLFLTLTNKLKSQGYKVNVENVKVKIENEEIYVYPDVLVTSEHFMSMKEYVVHQPILLAEVLSDSTRKYDSTDKFILYQKISSLKYYILVEPEKHVVFFYEKIFNNEWSAKVFNETEEIISLPKLNAEVSLADIYSTNG